LQLNLQVSSAPELQVETSAARLNGDVDLNVRGTAEHPVLIGTVNATEGEVVFDGARYQVNHAEITFNNPVRVEPVFDAELVTRIREYEVTLNFYGPLDRLNTTYRSEPPLPTADIVGLLAFGETRPETVQVTRPSLSLSQSESQAILEQAMNSALNDHVQKLFGVSRLRISPPETVGTQINPSARLTLERQVSRNMTVIYVTNVSQSSQQVIQMEYNVSPTVALVATRDQNGILSFDVRIRQRKR
jgi:translocation and assembly module TamB